MLLETAIQDNRKSASDSAIDEIMNDQYLTDEQLKLLSGIVELFDPTDDIDSSILYECTGYQSELQKDTFWEEYEDFVTIGDTKLTRADKDETILARFKEKAGIVKNKAKGVVSML